MRKFLFWSIVFLFALGSCQDNDIGKGGEKIICSNEV